MSFKDLTAKAAAAMKPKPVETVKSSAKETGAKETGAKAAGKEAQAKP